MIERRFKFRAQVVLDLRQRRDEEAQRVRAEREAAVRVAERALAEAEERLREGCGHPLAHRQTGIDVDWYRNWMVGLRAAIDRRTQELTKRRAERDEALARALAARRDLRAIERLRDRRRKTFDLESRRLEQQQIDALAVQQFTPPARGPGGYS